MALLNVFVVFASGSPRPIGVALSKADLDAAYSQLPDGASVQPGQAITDTDGKVYLVASEALPVFTAASLTSKKALREQAFAKLSSEEVAALAELTPAQLINQKKQG